MKKLLALVLALVMTLGLATVGANAAYKDADSINYKEAVDVMSAIGILAGDETGFRPADTLKRSEGAKIVAYLLVGNKAAEALQGTGTKFSDLPANHWAAGYMEYLASVGVMGGVGDGKIDPDGQLTATAFGKMLLCALGYDAEIEEFGGADWAINVQKVANQVGIYDGNRAVVGSAAVTREEAALYSFNTIKSPLVEYDTQVSVQLDNGSIKVGSNKAQAVTSNKYADQTISFDTDTTTDRYLVEFAERYYPDLKIETLTDDATGEYDLDDFGRPCREWSYNKAKIGEYVATAGLVYTWTAKVTPKKVYDVLGKNTYDNLKKGPANGIALVATVDGENKGTINIGLGHNVVDWGYIADNIDNFIARNDDSYAVNGSGNGSVTQLFLDEDGNVYLATVNPYVFKASSDYNASTGKIVIQSAGDTAEFINLDSYTLDDDDFEEIVDFKADDYLIVNAYKDGATYTVDSVAKAELLTGEVSSFKTNTSVVIGGETKEYSKKTTSTTTSNVAGTVYTVGQSASVVLDPNGYIIAVDEAVVAQNYVFVAALGSTSSLSTKVIGNAYFTDGTNKEITVKQINNDKTSAYMLAASTETTAIGAIKKTTAAAGGPGTDRAALRAGWYTYTTDSDGEYSLTPIAGNNAQIMNQYTDADDTNDTAVVKSGEVKFLPSTINGDEASEANTVFSTSAAGTNANTLKANDKTIMVVEQGGSVDVYTGVKNLPNITIKEDSTKKVDVFTVYNKANLYASYVFVTMDDVTAADIEYYDASSAGLLYVLSKEGTYTTTDQKTYTKYNVLDETGAKIVVEADDSAPFGTGGIYKTFYKTSKDTNNRYSKATALGVADNGSGHYFSRAEDTNAGADKISYSSGTLNISGLGFTMADDAKIYLITLKGANSINKTAADYEVQVVSGQSLASLLNSYTEATYIAEGRVDGSYTDGDTVLKELYVTVTGYGNGIINPTYAATVTGLPNVANSVYYTVTDSNSNVVTAKTLKTSNATSLPLTLEQGTYTITVETGTAANTIVEKKDLTLTVNTSGTGTVAYPATRVITLDQTTATPDGTWTVTKDSDSSEIGSKAITGGASTAVYVTPSTAYTAVFAPTQAANAKYETVTQAIAGGTGAATVTTAWKVTTLTKPSGAADVSVTLTHASGTDTNKAAFPGWSGTATAASTTLNYAGTASEYTLTVTGTNNEIVTYTNTNEMLLSAAAVTASGTVEAHVYKILEADLSAGGSYTIKAKVKVDGANFTSLATQPTGATIKVDVQRYADGMWGNVVTDNALTTWGNVFSTSAIGSITGEDITGAVDDGTTGAANYRLVITIMNSAGTQTLYQYTTVMK